MRTELISQLIQEREQQRRSGSARLSEIAQIKADKVEATRKLAELIKLRDDDGDGVRELVNRGANVCEQICSAHTILHHCVMVQKLDSLKELLSTAGPIDFTTINDTFDTPFHMVFLHIHGREFSIDALKLLVARIETNPKDIVDFNMKDHHGVNFINRVVRRLWRPRH